MKVLVPLRTGRGMNNREHHMQRHKRVKAERQMVAWMLSMHKPVPKVPCVVTITRVGPTSGLDQHDNLRGALKGPVDQVAEWLGVDDRDPRVTWKYEQRREKEWGVEIVVDEVAQVCQSAAHE